MRCSVKPKIVKIRSLVMKKMIIKSVPIIFSTTNNRSHQEESKYKKIFFALTLVTELLVNSKSVQGQLETGSCGVLDTM